MKLTKLIKLPVLVLVLVFAVVALFASCGDDVNYADQDQVNEALQQIEDRVTELASSLDGKTDATALANLKKELQDANAALQAALQAEIDAIESSGIKQSDFDEIKNKMNSLDQSVKTVQENIATLQGSLNTAKSELNAAVAEAKESITQTKKSLEDAYKAAISQAKSEQKAELKQLWEAADTTITNAYKAADTQLKQYIEQADQNITTAYTAAIDAAKQADQQALSDAKTALQKQIDELKSSIQAISGEASEGLTQAYQAADEQLAASLKAYVDEQTSGMKTDWSDATNVLSGEPEEEWLETVEEAWEDLVERLEAKLEGLLTEEQKETAEAAGPYSWEAFNVIKSFINPDNYDVSAYAGFRKVEYAIEISLIRSVSIEKIVELFEKYIEEIEKLPTLAEVLYETLAAIYAEKVIMEHTHFGYTALDVPTEQRARWLKALSLYDKVTALTVRYPEADYYRWDDAAQDQSYVETDDKGSVTLIAEITAAVSNLENSYSSALALAKDIIARRDSDLGLGHEYAFVRLVDEPFYLPLRDGILSTGDDIDGRTYLQTKFFDEFALNSYYPANFNTVGDKYHEAAYTIDNVVNYVKDYYDNGSQSLQDEEDLPSLVYYEIFDRLEELNTAKADFINAVSATGTDAIAEEKGYVLGGHSFFSHEYTDLAIVANQNGGADPHAVLLPVFAKGHFDDVIENFTDLGDWFDNYELEATEESHTDYEGNLEYIYRIVTNNTFENLEKTVIMVLSIDLIKMMYFDVSYSSFDESCYEFTQNEDAVVPMDEEATLAELIIDACNNKYAKYAAADPSTYADVECSVIELARADEYKSYFETIKSFEETLNALGTADEIGSFYNSENIPAIYEALGIVRNQLSNENSGVDSVLERIAKLEEAKTLVDAEYDLLYAYYKGDAEDKVEYAKQFAIIGEDGKPTGEMSDTYYWTFTVNNFNDIFRTFATTNVPTVNSIRSRLGNCLADTTSDKYIAGIYGAYDIEKAFEDDDDTKDIVRSENGWNYDFITKDIEELYENAFEYYTLLQEDLYRNYVEIKAVLDSFSAEYPLQFASALTDEARNAARLIKSYNISGKYLALIDENGGFVEVNFSGLATDIHDDALVCANIASKAAAARTAIIAKAENASTSYPLNTIPAGTPEEFNLISYLEENYIDAATITLDQADLINTLYDDLCKWVANNHEKGANHETDNLVAVIADDSALVDEIEKVKSVDARVLNEDGNAWEIVNGVIKTESVAYNVLGTPYVLFSVDEANAIIAAHDAMQLVIDEASDAWETVSAELKALTDEEFTAPTIHGFGPMLDAFDHYVEYREAYYLSDDTQHQPEVVEASEWEADGAQSYNKFYYSEMTDEHNVWAAFRETVYDHSLYVTAKKAAEQMNRDAFEFIMGTADGKHVYYDSTAVTDPESLYVTGEKVEIRLTAEGTDPVLTYVNFNKTAINAAVEIANDLAQRLDKFDELFDNKELEDGDACRKWFTEYSPVENVTFNVPLEITRITYAAQVAYRCFSISSNASTGNDAYMLYRDYIKNIKLATTEEEILAQYESFFDQYEALVSQINAEHDAYNFGEIIDGLFTPGTVNATNYNSGIFEVMFHACRKESIENYELECEFITVFEDEDHTYTTFNANVDLYNVAVATYNAQALAVFGEGKFIPASEACKFYACKDASGNYIMCSFED